MQTLKIETPIPFVLGAGTIQIVLVGCGGTGGYIAQHLARLAAHRKAAGLPYVHLVFMDGDTVEDKNIGRQLFSAAEIGRNKAKTLAARFNAAFGLTIQAVPYMATAQLLNSRWQSNRRGDINILIGAVDNPEARRLFATQLGHVAPSGWRLWMDCGNHEHAGQVSLGNVARSEQMLGSIKLGGSLCAALPGPHLQDPDLLSDPEQPLVRADCAAAMEDGRQSLMINSLVAGIASEYVRQLLFDGRVTSFRTVVDAQSLSMRSTPITPETLAAASKLPISKLHEQPAKPIKKQTQQQQVAA